MPLCERITARPVALSFWHADRCAPGLPPELERPNPVLNAVALDAVAAVAQPDETFVIVGRAPSLSPSLPLTDRSRNATTLGLPSPTPVLPRLPSPSPANVTRVAAVNTNTKRVSSVLVPAAKQQPARLASPAPVPRLAPSPPPQGPSVADQVQGACSSEATRRARSACVM